MIKVALAFFFGVIIGVMLMALIVVGGRYDD